jgi:hypothetical protein
VLLQDLTPMASRGYLFHGKHPVRVRRRLPNRHPQPLIPPACPFAFYSLALAQKRRRWLHRPPHQCPKPLVEAVESLCELVKLTVLTPPTFPTLETASQQAAEAGQPFDVMHFDASHPARRP